MRSLVTCIGAVLIGAGPVWAGPVDTPLPPNPCSSALFRLSAVANGVGTDVGGPLCPAPGAGCAETVVVCHHSGKTGTAPIDVAIELFDSAGNLIAGPPVVACSVPPGGSAPFATTGAPLLPPYLGIPIPIGPQVPLGSLRVLSTAVKMVACDVTLLDTNSIGSSFAPGPAGTTAVVLTRITVGQQGD